MEPAPRDVQGRPCPAQWDTMAGGTGTDRHRPTRFWRHQSCCTATPLSSSSSSFWGLSLSVHLVGRRAGSSSTGWPHHCPYPRVGACRLAEPPGLQGGSGSFALWLPGNGELQLKTAGAAGLNANQARKSNPKASPCQPKPKRAPTKASRERRTPAFKQAGIHCHQNVTKRELWTHQQDRDVVLCG